MEFNIRYGSVWALDQVGFIATGKIEIQQDKIFLKGRRRWPWYIQLVVFLCLTILPLFVFKVGLGFLLALIILPYICASSEVVEIPKKDITAISCNGKVIDFMTANIKGNKYVKCLFRAQSNEEAQKISSMLETAKIPKASFTNEEKSIIQCPLCNAKMRLESESARNKTTECLKCKQSIFVP